MVKMKNLYFVRYFARQYCKNIYLSKDRSPEVLTTYRNDHITEIIDVRTPDEFQVDHIPEAINLPVLSNEERIEVGILYKKDKFEARKLGAALITKNISEHLKQYFSSKSQEYTPLVYCWRGGQRSYSLSLVLSQVGFRTFVLAGGYKNYRENVREELSTLPNKFQYKIISGPTGSGKTAILYALNKMGHQVLDLEGLAKHKGSVLGLWHGEIQPTQKKYESLLCHKLNQFNPQQPVWMESESVRIGNLFIPTRLFEKLKESSRYSINLPFSERVNHILKDYTNLIENQGDLKQALKKLVAVRGHSMVNHWLDLIDNGCYAEFVESMLQQHYDPTYNLSQAKNVCHKDVRQFNIPNLNEESLKDLVNKITKL